MRAKRKASRESTKHTPTRPMPKTTASKAVDEKASKEELSRFENEGGAEGSISEVAG